MDKEKSAAKKYARHFFLYLWAKMINTEGTEGAF